MKGKELFWGRIKGKKIKKYMGQDKRGGNENIFRSWGDVTETIML